MEVAGDPNFPRDISCVQFLNERKQRFEGPEKVVLTDLMEFIKVHDPDVILFPYADTWVPIIVKKAKRLGFELTFSRSGFFKSMASKSYWSYGKVNHKDGALIPEGRVLIDTAKSFVYTEGGLKGVLMASRLSGLSPTSPPVSPLARSSPLTRSTRPYAVAWPCLSGKGTPRASGTSRS
jgi:DNA polymerase I